MLQHSAIGRAQFDPTGVYRYSLERCWQVDGDGLAMILLNPSRADQAVDDPTLRCCSRLAQHWGFGRLEVVNLFAYCTPHPWRLKQVSAPVGPENDVFLEQACQRAARVLLAWGNGGIWLGRDRQVLGLLDAHRHKFGCLGRNRTGQPRHPLYVRRDAAWQSWSVGG